MIKHEAKFISRKFSPFLFVPSLQKIRDYKNGFLVLFGTLELFLKKAKMKLTLLGFLKFLELFSPRKKKERIKKRMEKKETAIIFTTLKHRFFVFTKSNEWSRKIDFLFTNYVSFLGWKIFGLNKNSKDVNYFSSTGNFLFLVSSKISGVQTSKARFFE